ncbi:hypothetical protein OIV83_000059 [Microbotryomycetes sp. JL201]|nr:hypothetical protein OIV83_000059 [Microbotryomycetes sp. JL201]
MTSTLEGQHGPPPTDTSHSNHLMMPNESLPATAQLEATLEGLLQSLLEIGICASDVQPSAVETAPDGVASGFPGGLVGRKISQTLDHLASLYGNKDSVADINIPLDVINYVDQGKNPHTYTREMIERVAGENMYTNGILSAVSEYHDILTSQMSEAFPELASMVKNSSTSQVNGDEHNHADVKMEH